MILFQFEAVVTAPGICDTAHFWAQSYEVALEQAERYRNIAWKGLGPTRLRTVTVDPCWRVAALPDGRIITRQQYDEMLATRAAVASAGAFFDFLGAVA